MIILQWNARSLVANGEALKGFIKGMNQMWYTYKTRNLNKTEFHHKKISLHMQR